MKYCLSRKECKKNNSKLIELAEKTQEFYNNNKTNFNIFELGMLLNEAWELKEEICK